MFHKDDQQNKSMLFTLIWSCSLSSASRNKRKTTPLSLPNNIDIRFWENSLDHVRNLITLSVDTLWLMKQDFGNATITH